MSPHILMCAPEFYGIEYEINPWMNTERKVNHGLAVEQWNDLRNLLESVGAEISLVSPKKGQPDLVFTANAGLVFRHDVILSRFRHPQRQGEEPLFEARLSELGFRVRQLKSTMNFEGAGDALFCGDTLFAGYRKRSDALSHQLVGEFVGRRVIPMELVDDYYYHLDTCFCPLSPTQAIYYPEAFDDYGRKSLEEHVEQLFPVPESEARAFACNAVVVGRDVVTNAGCPQLHETLTEHGFRPHSTPLGEFVKSGGSAKCLTLRLDGEEAASWKRLPDVS